MQPMSCSGEYWRVVTEICRGIVSFIEHLLNQVFQRPFTNDPVVIGLVAPRGSLFLFLCQCECVCVCDSNHQHNKCFKALVFISCNYMYVQLVCILYMHVMYGDE